MTYMAPRTEQQSLLESTGTLLVLRAPVVPPAPAPGQPGVVSVYLQDYDDVFVAVSEQGWVRAFCGHVDLGTGIQTALAQIVADELDVPMSAVQMVLGHTDASPNQGPTIASASIQITARPLRQAAAQARHILVDLAADMWNVDAEQLSVQNGRISSAHGQAIDYWALLAGKQYREYLRDDIQTKAAKDLKIVGHSQPVWISPPRRWASLPMSMMCGCLTCGMAGSYGRPMSDGIRAPLSATAWFQWMPLA